MKKKKQEKQEKQEKTIENNDEIIVAMVEKNRFQASKIVEILEKIISSIEIMDSEVLINPNVFTFLEVAKECLEEYANKSYDYQDKIDFFMPTKRDFVEITKEGVFFYKASPGNIKQLIKFFYEQVKLYNNTCTTREKKRNSIHKQNRDTVVYAMIYAEKLL